MKKLVLTGVLLFAALLFAGTQQGYAYDNVTSTPDGGCLACHTFAGGAGAQHTAHTSASVACASCHAGGVPGKNVASSTCIVCHPTGDVGACNLVVAHGSSSSCLTCHTSCAPPPAGQAECADWVGDWKFTYDNATQTTVCFDNASLDNETFILCDNDSAPNCKCIQDVTAEEICINSVTFEECDPDNFSAPVAECFCFDNPYFKDPSVPNGTYDVVITTVSDNFSAGPITFDCFASGTRGTQPITIARPTNASLAAYGQYFPNVDNGTYLVYEGSGQDISSLPFAMIPQDQFTKDNDSVQFTTTDMYNFLGLVSGIKSDNVTPPECEQNLRVIPGTIFKLLAFVNPFSPFVIIAERESGVEFDRPISIDWGTEAINDLIHIKLGKRLIFGFGFARPFQLVADDYIVKVTYGDPAAEACGELTVR